MSQFQFYIFVRQKNTWFVGGIVQHTNLGNVKLVKFGITFVN